MDQPKPNGLKNPKSSPWEALEHLILAKEEEILGSSFPGEFDFLDDADDKSPELNDDVTAEVDQSSNVDKTEEDEFQPDSSDEEEIFTDADDELKSRDANEVTNRRADELKEDGDSFCQRGKWRLAIDKYDESLRYNVLSTVLGNRSLCRMKLGEFVEAENDCDAALVIDPEYKRIYRRRVALRLRRKYYYGAALDLQTLIILSSTGDNNLLAEYKTLLPLARFAHFNSKLDADHPLRSILADMETEFSARFVDIEEKAATESANRLSWSTAVESLTMAISVAPNKSTLYAKRALAHLKRNLTEAAENDVKCAVRLEPNNVEYCRLHAKIRKIQNGTVLEETLRQSDSEPSTVRNRNDADSLLSGIVVRIPVVDVYSSGVDDIRDLSFVANIVKSRFNM